MDGFDRTKKRKKLKENLEVCLARQINKEQETKRRALTTEEKRAMRKSWEKSAERVDNTMLGKVWNPKKDEDRPTPVRGYFGGVSFDKQGKLI